MPGTGTPQRMNPAAKKKALGQYFTISARLQDYIYEKVQYKGAPLLEPSMGAGHLLQPFLQANAAYPVTAYEIDPTVHRLPLQPMQTPIIGDFLTADITEHYPTIIGNPPFVKRKGRPNLYIEFVAKCFDLLTPTGELLFIVPSDFLKLTSAAALITRMAAAGAFTDFLFPHDEGLFAGAAIDVVVFRYQRGLQQGLAQVNDEPKHVICNSGILTFSSAVALAPAEAATVQDLLDVYVGIVSACDAVYKKPFGTANVLIDKDKIERFILPRVWPLPITETEASAHLVANKATLMSRRIRKFKEDNWWQWGALRNITVVEAKAGTPCIYVRNMTRHDEIAFVGTVQLFGGGLICLIPKQPGLNLPPIVAAINQKRDDYIYSGRFKIGQKQLCCLSL